MQQSAIASLSAIAADAPSRETRTAAHLLIRALQHEVLREHMVELSSVAALELGDPVGLEFVQLAREWGLLPSVADRLRADFRR